MAEHFLAINENFHGLYFGKRLEDILFEQFDSRHYFACVSSPVKKLAAQIHEKSFFAQKAKFAFGAGRKNRAGAFSFWAQKKFVHIKRNCLVALSMRKDSIFKR